MLDDSETELEDLGYTRVRLDADSWDEIALHEAFATGLNFPDYDGRNIGALADCLYDVAHDDDGWDANAAGLAITIAGFGAFAEREPDLAKYVGRPDGSRDQCCSVVRAPAGLAGPS